MFCYQRKISFISYYINGIKSRSIGVVKQCLSEDGLNLSIDLFGLEDWRNYRCSVSIGNAQERQQIFETDICAGKSRTEYKLPMELLRKVKGTKIFFSLGSDCYGIADLCEIPDVEAAKTYDVKVCDTVEDIKEDSENVPDADEDIKEDSENVPDTVEITSKEDMSPEKQREADLLDDCLEAQPDKWEVIKKKYPILYPFKGQGPYVSIKPIDLQLLSSAYHHLSNNSFLMHNFYRYKHLILGEYTWEKGTFFYVGVPGEFVKKEQNAAAMFGFEGYEHSGELGYYLYRVEL